MGYLKLDTFSDNSVLTIQLWERAISTLNASKVPGLIIDMRQNRGGDGWLARQMAGYFFEEDTFYGTTSFYNGPGDESSMIAPRADLQYSGKVVVMVGPGCVSACEFFALGMTIENRATVIGQYPSAGGGGSVDQFVMPGGIFVQMPIGKTVDADGNILIEGVGIVPTVKVPVTVSTVIAAAKGTDVVLNAAEKQIESETSGGGSGG
jgi:C-terminal processing protease CtpA/Prc